MLIINCPMIQGTIDLRLISFIINIGGGST